MSEYAFSVFAICLVGGVLSLLCHGSGMGERIVLGIVTLYIIISPLAGGLSSIDIDRWMDSLKGESVQVAPGYLGVVEESFADGIALAVAEKFSLDRDNIRVSLRNFDIENMSAERIRVTLSGVAALADYKAVERYVNSLDLGECDVEIEIG